MSGPVQRLEQEFAAQFGVPGAVAAGFGRGALFLALQAAGIEGGDVAVPDFVCAQVPEAVTRAGGRPVFYPVYRDLTVRSEEFGAVVKRGCRAAIVTHYFGRVLPEIATLAATCRECGALLIEDCALALGAGSARRGERAGTFGDLAVFSFTKTDWCYGGGIVTARSVELLARLRQAREQLFVTAPMLAARYGLLRRLDFAANRPSRSLATARGGRVLQGLFGPASENFYDSGRFDVRMPAFTAPRAGRILQHLEATNAQRCRIVAELAGSLRGVEHILLRRSLDPGDTGAFLLLQSPAGRAAQWAEEASKEGVTLRLCWPAYQGDQRQWSGTLEWLASHLLILEIHPGLTEKETQQIAATLNMFGSRE